MTGSLRKASCDMFGGGGAGLPGAVGRAAWRHSGRARHSACCLRRRDRRVASLAPNFSVERLLEDLEILRAAQVEELFLERLGHEHFDLIGFAGVELHGADGVGFHRAFLREFFHRSAPGGFDRGGGDLSARRARVRLRQEWAAPWARSSVGAATAVDCGGRCRGRNRLHDGRRRRRGGCARLRRRAAERFEDAFERNLFLELAHLDQRDFEDDVLGQRVAQAAFEMAQFLQNAERRAARNQRRRPRRARLFPAWRFRPPARWARPDR